MRFFSNFEHDELVSFMYNFVTVARNNIKQYTCVFVHYYESIQGL